MFSVQKSGFDLFGKTKADLDAEYRKIKTEQERVEKHVKANPDLDPIDKLSAYSAIVKMQKALNEINKRRSYARG